MPTSQPRKPSLPRGTATALRFSGTAPGMQMTPEEVRQLWERGRECPEPSVCSEEPPGCHLHRASFRVLPAQEPLAITADSFSPAGAAEGMSPTSRTAAIPAANVPPHTASCLEGPKGGTPKRSPTRPGCLPGPFASQPCPGCAGRPRIGAAARPRPALC